jgi:predicted protein tyrosine phosphatase
VKIEIRGHPLLPELLTAEPGLWDLLLIGSPGRMEPPEGVASLARRTLRLCFDDCDVPQPGVVLPTADDVRRALEWSADSERLVVSCYLGRSRSAALAYILRCRDCPPQEALRILAPDWHRPNPLIVRLGSELLGNPAIRDECSDWMARHSGAVGGLAKA